MQEASDMRAGTMAAVIGLDESIMEEICMETGVEIANINSDDQLVISGDRLFVAKAMDLASMRGARKTIPLAVGGAFHSTLMYPCTGRSHRDGSRTCNCVTLKCQSSPTRLRRH